MVQALTKRLWSKTSSACTRGFHRVKQDGPGQFQFWLIALFIGIAAGGAAVLFRMAISFLQEMFYGADDEMLASTAAELPWFWVLIIPIIGGLVVGLILQAFTPDGRSRSLAHVIEGAALRDGRVENRAGLASTLASLITLSTGGSTGREGPVVHLGAVISSYISRLIKADGVTARDLMGCAAAAAVSASFNAPIAGTIFAMEVILRHYAFHAFAPIVIASVAGTLISRSQMGNVTEFVLPEANVLQFYVELPAFMILGLVCGLVSIVLVKSIFTAEDIGNTFQARTRIPGWLRPAVSGLLLGLLAIAFPHIIGVGYETTSRALVGDLLLWEAMVFCAVKVLAVAITIAGRMGGGVFSPSLMIGALTGLAFGLIATAIFPNVSGSVGLYALAGMGGVAASILGAPISTTLIVFELTGDWQTGLAVMVCVSLSIAVSAQLLDKSFFLTQLERRGVHLAAGPQAYLQATISVRDLMRPQGGDRSASETAAFELMEQGAALTRDNTLEDALPIFERLDCAFLPVIERADDGTEQLLGALYYVDALKAYNRALAALAKEEHS